MEEIVKKNDDCSPHGWTLDTLETHLSSKILGVVQLATEREAALKERLDATKEAIQAALTASDKAILKAEVSQDKRNEASNEIRAAMIDQQKNFAGKSEIDFRLDAIIKRIDTIENAIASMVGKSLGVEKTSDKTSSLINLVAGSVIAIVVFMSAVVGTIAYLLK